jgi:metal-sulfur cluster biosynthetic enzyme
VSALGGEPETARVQQARAAIAQVLDPCSVFNGTRLSLVELGMVSHIEEPAPGHLCIHMLLDDPVCIYVGQIHKEIHDAALSVPGVTRVEMRFIGNEIWTDEHATARARRVLRRRHASPLTHAPRRSRTP